MVIGIVKSKVVRWTPGEKTSWEFLATDQSGSSEYGSQV